MKRKTSATVIMYTVLVFFFVIWIFPIYTAITKSLQAGGWNSYLSVINNKDVHYFRVVFNSFFISVVTAVIVVVITTLAGYALAKMKFTGSQVFYVLLLACMAVPIASVTMPLFFTIKTFGLTNTYLGMIIPLVAFNALQMLLLWRNYFNGVPDEIIEAARVDGCGSLRIWARILMPISTPMIATTGVLTFVYSLSGFMAGMAGVVSVGRLASANGTAGSTDDNDAIAAWIVGGTGGKGTIWGTLSGALLMAVIRNGLNLMGASNDIQYIVIGAVIILAGTIDVFRNKAEAKARKMAAQ